MRVFRAIVAAAVLAGGLAGAPASAGPLIFEPLIFEYGGVQEGKTPAGTPPWLTAKFEDSGVIGQVRLTLTANLSDGFVTRALFNLNPELELKSLNANFPFPEVKFSTSTTTPIDGPDGTGAFDFEFTFTEKAWGDKGVIDQLVLIYPTTLVPDDFKYQSEPSGDSEEAKKKKAEEAKKKAAAKEQAEKEKAAQKEQEEAKEKEEVGEKKAEGKEKDDGLLKALAELEAESTPRYSVASIAAIEAWIFVTPQQNGVPEPGTLALLGMALVGVVAASRRRTRH